RQSLAQRRQDGHRELGQHRGHVVTHAGEDDPALEAETPGEDFELAPVVTRALVVAHEGPAADDGEAGPGEPRGQAGRRLQEVLDALEDRKITRLNSSHRTISYAVFCLKK